MSETGVLCTQTLLKFRTHRPFNSGFRFITSVSKVLNNLDDTV
jgi:hypothetical protein